MLLLLLSDRAPSQIVQGAVITKLALCQQKSDSRNSGAAVNELRELAARFIRAKSDSSSALTAQATGAQLLCRLHRDGLLTFNIDGLNWPDEAVVGRYNGIAAKQHWAALWFVLVDYLERINPSLIPPDAHGFKPIKPMENRVQMLVSDDRQANARSENDAAVCKAIAKHIEGIRPVALAVNGKPVDESNAVRHPATLVSEGPPVTINARMIDLLTRKPEAKDWSASQFAVALNCAKGSIGETTEWKTLMEARASAKAVRLERSTVKDQRGKRRPR